MSVHVNIINLIFPTILPSIIANYSYSYINNVTNDIIDYRKSYSNTDFNNY